MDANNVKQKILVLYSGSYAIPDEKTGVVNEGCSVSYYMLTDLQPVNNSDGTRGMRPAKCSVDSLWNSTKFTRVPGIYEAEFGFKVGSNGKPTLYIQDIDYLCDVHLELLLDAKAAGTADKKAV